jgi:SCP-2 sterol transfer family
VRIWLGERLIALDRHPVVHRVLVRALSRAIALRFDPSAARDLEATLELALRDPHGRPTARYAVQICQGRCAVRPGAPDSAGARASIGSDDLILLASGGIGWPELFSSGRFELTGDPFLALRFASLFRLPVVLDPV